MVLLRQLSLLSHDSLSDWSSLYLLLFFLSFLFGAFFSTLYFRNIKRRKNNSFSEKAINRKANLLISFSLVSIGVLVVNYLSTMSGDFSLAGITQQRFDEARDVNHEMGGTILGALGLLLSGFTIVQYIYKEYFGAYLSARKKRAMDFVFIGGILASFLAGGRWAATVALLVVAIIYFFQKYNLCSSNRSLKGRQGPRTKNTRLANLSKISFLLLIVYVFSRMFLDRVGISDDDLGLLLDILANNFEGVTVSRNHEQFLAQNPSLVPVYYVVSLFQYYVTHGFYQFDVLIAADYPASAPYYGAYQFYLQALVFKKMGLDLVPISQILAEIPSSGVYLTLAGAYLLDFGYWGGVVASFATSFIGTYFWMKFLAQRLFFDMYICILFLVLVIMSPIVAITGTGVYPSLLSLAIILKIFVPKTWRG